MCIASWRWFHLFLECCEITLATRRELVNVVTLEKGSHCHWEMVRSQRRKSWLEDGVLSLANQTRPWAHVCRRRWIVASLKLLTMCLRGSSVLEENSLLLFYRCCMTKESERKWQVRTSRPKCTKKGGPPDVVCAWFTWRISSWCTTQKSQIGKVQNRTKARVFPGIHSNSTLPRISAWWSSPPHDEMLAKQVRI